MGVGEVLESGMQEIGELGEGCVLGRKFWSFWKRRKEVGSLNCSLVFLSQLALKGEVWRGKKVLVLFGAWHSSEGWQSMGSRPANANGWVRC